MVHNTLEIPSDWTTLPFVDITVIDLEENCPEGSESVFERVWYGMKAACNVDPDSADGLIVGDKCKADINDVVKGETVGGWAAVK